MPSYTDLGIPASGGVVNLRVFDIAPPNSKSIAALFMLPVLPGNEVLIAPMYSFLIEHPTNGKRIMFDLGPRKDLLNSAPVISDRVKNKVFDFNIEKDITERLAEAEITLDSISAVIWSHAHFDHTGDMSKFPPTTKLVIGQDTARDIYPANPQGKLLESDFSGREVTELNFDKSTFSIGGFRALDYFGDGSVYLLDIPGHLSGHIGALVRVTSTTFILLAGDAYHHAGQLRPTEQLHRHFPCPGEIIEAARHAVSVEYFTPVSEDGTFDLARRMEPLLTIPTNTTYEDVPTASASLQKLGVFDGNEDVFLMTAHDLSLVPIVEEFPASLNEWKAKGWKEKGTWAFIDERNPAFRFGVKEAQ